MSNGSMRPTELEMRFGNPPVAKNLRLVGYSALQFIVSIANVPVLRYGFVGRDLGPEPKENEESAKVPLLAPVARKLVFSVFRMYDLISLGESILRVLLESVFVADGTMSISLASTSSIHAEEYLKSASWNSRE